MREIKFRAWDGKQMTTSGIMFNTSTGCVEVPKEASFGGTLTFKYVLMQFTGLKDKNGKEIYEGDIIDCGKYHGKKEVVFINGSYKIRGRMGQLIGFGSWARKTIIIGNIYENLELLK